MQPITTVVILTHLKYEKCDKVFLVKYFLLASLTDTQGENDDRIGYMDPNRLNSQNDLKRSIIFNEASKSSETAKSQPMLPPSQGHKPPKVTTDLLGLLQ